jgi:hypothetical protein
MIGTIAIIVWIILCFLGFIRVQQVHDYRGKLIDKIGALNRKEIENDYEYDTWRWDEFESVSFNKQVLMFWKPLDSFYRPELTEDRTVL